MNYRKDRVEGMKRRILFVSQVLSRYGAEVTRDVLEAVGGLVNAMKEGQRNE